LESHQDERILIVNGEIAEKGRYPYFVTLKHYGGGALIAPDIVLTAGHTKPLHKHDVKPHVGTYDFETDMKGVDYEEFEILKSIQFDGFVRINDDDFIRDFTILKLNGHSKHSVVKINRDHSIPHDFQEVIAMGVGDTSSNPKRQEISNVLRQVNLNVISNAECEMAHSDERNLTYHNRIYPSMMCTTGGPHNERDSCSYDSGSPIIIPHEHHGDLLVGLVSWGEGCADPDFPAVNARVSQVSDWIDAVVCEISDYPPADFCHSQKWKIPTREMVGMTIVVGLSVLGFVMFRSHKNKQVVYENAKHSSPTLTEQLSLCDSSCSSGEDYQTIESSSSEHYQAIEMEPTM
jgi:secreted trypsin-like serine protease